MKKLKYQVTNDCMGKQKNQVTNDCKEKQNYQVIDFCKKKASSKKNQILSYSYLEENRKV